jgi:hypothetical protein
MRRYWLKAKNYWIWIGSFTSSLPCRLCSFMLPANKINFKHTQSVCSLFSLQIHLSLHFSFGLFNGCYHNDQWRKRWLTSWWVVVSWGSEESEGTYLVVLIAITRFLAWSQCEGRHCWGRRHRYWGRSLVCHGWVTMELLGWEEIASEGHVG